MSEEPQESLTRVGEFENKVRALAADTLPQSASAGEMLLALAPIISDLVVIASDKQEEFVDDYAFLVKKNLKWSNQKVSSTFKKENMLN